MVESRDTLFFHWSDSLQKYDHFIAGLLAAWVAYLIRDFHPAKITFCPVNASAVETIGIATLILALVAAVLRIGRLIDNVRISYDLVPFEAKKLELESVPQATPVYATPTGEPLTAEQRRGKEDHIKDVVERGHAAHLTHARFARVCYHVRNIGGLLGILLLFAARILAAH